MAIRGRKDPQLDAAIIRLTLEGGRTQAEIATLLGCSDGHVNRVIKRNRDILKPSGALNKAVIEAYLVRAIHDYKPPRTHADWQKSVELALRLVDLKADDSPSQEALLNTLLEDKPNE